MGGRGGGECESCAIWREHYWNHTSDNKKQFLVVASDDFRHSMVRSVNRMAVSSLSLSDSGFVNRWL
jgi:hypothetical protein